MSNKEFVSNLSATYADVRKLDVKKINLKGKNILEYIKESVPTIKHSQDTRETITENDLWGQWVETTTDGTIIVHDDWVTNPNSSNSVGWNTSITKVEDNKAYVGDTLYANIQLEKIKDGSSMFSKCIALTSFSSDLPNLTNGGNMFKNCTNLKSFSSDLSSLTDSGSMFMDCSNLASFSSDLSSLTYGYRMFQNCTNLASFSSDLSSLTYGGSMFEYCSNLTSFTSDLPSLTNSSWMFRDCTNLTSFSSDLSSLTYGYGMFRDCTNLASFTSDLSSLMNGERMFEACESLTTFSSDLSSLTYSNYMFPSCTNLTSFTSDLPSLTDGYYMFFGCTNLKSFSSDLSSLTYGGSMFYKCKIDAESVMYIADTIKDITAEKQLYSDGTIPGTIPYVTLSNGVYSATRGFMSDGTYVYTFNNPKPYTTTIGASYVGKLTLGINVTNNSSTIKQQLEDFAQEATFETWADLKTHFSKKGWTVTFQYGGTTNSITYDIRNGEQIIPCPIFAKLVETDKESAEYCTEDASTFYNIEWGHDSNTNNEGYDYFESLEEAIGAYGVIPKA